LLSKVELTFEGTTRVSAYSFEYEEYKIFLVDTPGFNDTDRTETQVLKEIADWLEKTYRDPPHIKLSGIIYLQSICETRMFGSTLRNLKMFRELCGEQPLRNVVLATTCWDKKDPLSEDREEQLRTDPAFWQQMILKGSRLARVTSRDSALSIIMSLAQESPTLLAIQDELVNQEKKLVDTKAGRTVNEELEKLSKIHQTELSKLKQEMIEANKARDVELQEALAAASEVQERALDRIQRDQESLRYERRAAQRRHQQDLEDARAEAAYERSRIQREREEDKRAYEMRLNAQKVESEMNFDDIIARFRRNEGKVREEERICLQQMIQDAKRQPVSSKRGSNLLVSAGMVMGSVAMTALGFPMILGDPFSGIMDVVDQLTNSQ
jgi:predicted GTPase